jgi:uncharacterized membrane-anchored protein YitT (DUF2179 family)
MAGTSEWRQVLRMFMLVVGAGIVSVGLELFLVPNQIIDGGVVGISIMASYLTKLPLGLFLVILNLPFMVVGYNQIGKRFVISSLIALGALAVFVTYLNPKEPLTDDLLLGAIFGGVFIGTGVGIILRSGGCLDGTEIMAILIQRSRDLSIGEVIMFFNVFILGSSALVFGWDRALYSLIAYFVASKAIDVVVDGLNESKSVFIISNKHEEISRAILESLGRGVTHIFGKGGCSGEDKEILFSVVTRLELATLKSIINEIDPGAFIAIENVHEVLGGSFKKLSIH